MIRIVFVLFCIIGMLNGVYSQVATPLGLSLPEGKKKVRIPFEIHDNLIVIPVVINEALPLNFILDTGVRTAILTEKSLGDMIAMDYSRKVQFYGPGGENLVEAYIASSVSIEMPGIKGLDLLRSLSHPPQVIVTTAYREYAVEGFELDLIDYLVKPIPFPRFLKAIDRFHERNAKSIESKSSTNHVFVRADRKSVRIDLDEILYIQGIKDYVKIVLQDRTVMTKVSIGNFFKYASDE